MKYVYFLSAVTLLVMTLRSTAAEWHELDAEAMSRGAAMYKQYCALCHGEDRSGYKADHAPSLRSKSLLSTAFPEMLFNTIRWGRTNTPMDGYGEEMGGPLAYDDVLLLTAWLRRVSGVHPIELPDGVIVGDKALGGEIYTEYCAECHGESGEGVTAPAIGHQALLAFASDHYLHYAIANGRDGTPMRSFTSELRDDEINAVVAYLRSQSQGWTPNPPDLVEPPEPKDYVMNPNGEDPEFSLRADRYVPAAEVLKALKTNKRFILLDTRPASAWQRSHIPGAVPWPYYGNDASAADALPNDGTWIVAYCACPHAASDSVIDGLEKLGYRNLAVIDEGILRWTAMGLPVTAGATKKAGDK